MQTFEEIQRVFMIINKLNKLGLEGNFFNLIKSIYKNPKTNIILNGELSKAFSLKIQKTRITTIITSIHLFTVGASQ